MSFRLTHFLLASALFAIAASAEAASLRVRVRTPQGEAGGRLRLDGVGAPRELDFDREGALLVGVEPGEHALSVDIAGFGGVQRRLQIGRGERLELRAIFDARGRPGRIEVIERVRDALGDPFDAASLSGTPSGGDAFSLLETANAVFIADRIDGGGLYAGEPGRLTAHGASWTQVGWRLGDVDVTDPDQGGRPLLIPETSALQELACDTAALPASRAFAGPVIELVPRRPATEWRGEVSGTSSLGEATAPDGPPPVARLMSLRAFDARIGGPVTERLRVAAFAAWTRSRRETRREADPLASRRATLRGALDWDRGSGDRWSGEAWLQSARRPFEGSALFAGPAVEAGDRSAHAQATWRRTTTSGGRWRASAGWTRAVLSPDLGIAPGTVERLLDGPVPLLAPPARRVRGRLDSELEWELSPRSAGPSRHLLDFVASFGRRWSRLDPLAAGFWVAESVDGEPARFWDYTLGDSRQAGNEWSLAARDRVLLGARVSLEAGLRFTQSSAASGASSAILWRTLDPRLRARVRVADSLSLFAGFGRYTHRLPLRWAAWGDAQAPSASVYLWRDSNGDGLPQTTERGPLVARVGPGGSFAAIDEALVAPRLNEYVAGFEARLGEAFRMTFAGVRRDESSLVESVNVGVPYSSYSVYSVPDPSGDIHGTEDDQLLPLYVRDPATYGDDRYLLTNPPGLDAYHEGVEVTFAGRWPRAWFRAGATAHRSVGSGANRGFRPQENDQALVGELLDEPNADTFARGRLFSDRAYTITIEAGGRGPAGVRLDAVARYQDGQPFARVLIVDLGAGPEPVQAIPNGRARFTYTFTLDARVEKTLQVGRSRLGLALEGFNLLGTNHEVEEYVVTGPDYRSKTYMQPPRVLRASLSLRF